MLPSTVDRALRSDPDQTDSRVMPLLRYAEAHAVYRRAKPHELKTWAGNRWLDRVTDIDMEFVQAEIDAAASGAASAPDPVPHPHLRLLPPVEEAKEGLGGS